MVQRELEERVNRVSYRHLLQSWRMLPRYVMVSSKLRVPLLCSGVLLGSAWGV